MKPITTLLAISVAALTSAVGAAPLSLPKVFTDNMVLQRGLAVPVWGSAEPNATVSVSFAGQEKSATAGGSGKWSLKLDKLAASAEGRDVTVTSGDKTVTLKNVLVGDVWICSGQSNMEWSVRASKNPQEEIAAAKHPTIRVFDVPGHTTSPVALNQLPGNPRWQPVTPQSIPNFSAVGFYFSRAIQESAPDVPVGLIGTNWGGTRVEPWTPPVGFRTQPELAQVSAEVDKFDPSTEAGKQTWNTYFDEIGHWNETARKSLFEQGVLPAQPVMPGFKAAQQPTAIYNAMVHPLVPFGVRGAIWYQGESNGAEGLAYQPKLQALIEGWRKVWNQGDDFPFYFYVVQLANFGAPKPNEPGAGDGYAAIRIAQRNIIDSMDHTGLACIIDIGEAKDIHPRNKQDVGRRLARWALRDVHGKSDTVVSGPVFKEMKVEGGKAVIHFDHVGGGLMVGKKEGLEPVADVSATGKLSQFAIAGEDRKFHWAEATIEGETLVVSCPEVPAPVAVRYAYAHNPEGANLYNKAGLPAVPFKTDEW